MFGVYPFMDAKLEDFEPVFAKLIELNLSEPIDFDQYAAPFFPVAEDLANQAQEEETSGDVTKASELYLRAAALYRIARFPVPRSPKQKEAWERNKEAYAKGGRYLKPPMIEYKVPHTHALPGTTEAESYIPICVRRPHSIKAVPTVIQIFGLDGYRTEFTPASSLFTDRGWAAVAVEIPGTGDCPALRQDPKSPDRLWSSLLDWLEAEDWVDKKNIVAWGLSTGGYYAIRIAHTHKERLSGVVAQGGGCHRMFDPEWLDNVGHLEYPFDLDHSLAVKFGYDDVETMKKGAQKRFSLLESGILDQQSTRLLLVNGMNDSIFPIEDSLLPLQHGSIKEARYIPGASHMGEPAATKIILPWIEQLVHISG
ncbi:hypothetical protein MMC18_007491 [Xylographa bjoerkii]|nr:hypothetical protein [Xylographa bjoerkii]